MMRTWQPSWPIDLDLVLAPLTRGREDPVARRMTAQDWWLTGTTDDGPAALHLSRAGDAVVGRAWGPGGAELLQRMPHMLGDDDRPEGFDPEPGTVVAAQWRRRGSSWRVPATGLVFQTAVQAVLEQKVTGIESRRAWYRLCLEHGSAAPGPVPPGMRVAPDRAAVAAVPSWWWRSAGVDHARSGTVLRLARTRLPGEDAAAVGRRLAAVAGIGPWTVAEVAFRALGDADAVSVGDFHLANLVGYALAGRARSTDEQMLELLTPYNGHRHRAIRMIELSGVRQPRFGPKIPLPTHRGS